MSADDPGEPMTAADRKALQRDRESAGLAIFRLLLDEDALADMLVERGFLDPLNSDSRPHVQDGLCRYLQREMSRVTSPNRDLQ